METLKLDFTIDYITGKKIPINEYRQKLRASRTNRKSNNCFISEIADFYYQEKYLLNIVQVLGKMSTIPICPITGNYVSYKLSGHIAFGKFSSDCPIDKMTQYIADNNESFKAHVEKMKIDRKGIGNPRYGTKPWNKGLNIETNSILKEMGEKKRGSKHTNEAKQKQSDSAKTRKIHGHTGIKHSDESKQIMREKTIARFKNGDFSQLDSSPAKKTGELIEEVFGKENLFFEKEFGYGLFSFDFLVYPNILIEVQGDYFHCNPNTRHAVPKNDMQKNNLERDKRKRKFVNDKNEFVLIEFWEHDILNNPDKIKTELCNLKKL